MRAVKGSIRRKITLVIAASIVVVATISALFTYFVGSAVLKNILGREYSQIADALNTYTMSAFKDEVEDATAYATRRLWRGAVQEVNLRYEGMSAESIKFKLLDMDSKWIAAKPGDPILKEYLENEVSISMKDALKARTNVSEIFITDKYGGLVAASAKTSDFYQADEDWWQAAYNGGKGRVYVSDIEFDESSKQWAISIAVPIRDLRSNEIIGICKDVVGVKKLFDKLERFKLGNTGRVVLINNEGAVIFHHGVPAMTTKAFSEKTLRSILESKKPYLIVDSPLFHGSDIFIASSKAAPPYLSDKNTLWVMLITQDASEVFAPIHNFVIRIALIAVLAIISAIPIGAFLSRFISDPIHKLHMATERIMVGDWDYKIDVRTGDEIEQFAGTFTGMIADIKDKQRKLQSFSDGLEAKVKERTKELSVAQEATLNIMEDLQESKEALERTNRDLMKLDELKSEFISTVSHELRTPLSIIKEGISLVLDKIPGSLNEKQSKILDISKYNIDRLARIIDSLLDLSKIESGKAELKRSLINITDVVKQAAGLFEARIREKGLEMRLDIDNVAGSVWADADRIMQVLTNLLANAVRFTGSGHIEISCKDRPDGVVCSVSDTGVGISKDDLPKVFEKFQQFGRTAGAGDKGTGLGLSIAKNIIDMHNGTIWVESDPAKGSKFAFKLRKYTPESLFGEYVSKAVERAANKGAEMSMIAVKFVLTGTADTSGMITKKFDDMARESAGLIKAALRHKDDDVVSSGCEMVVVLADCGKESAAKVQYRLEKMINKYLAEQDAVGAIRINYGCATYPDDAKNELKLIEKAKAALAASAKA